MEPKLYSSHAIANEFIKLAEEQGRQLTNMQLQKLVYIANGFSLAINDRPLYFEDTQAWQWGPVIPKLYKSLRKYGSSTVTDFLETDDKVDQTSQDAEIIRAVFENYGRYTGSQLSALTHQPNTPWHETWNDRQFSSINPEVIKKHYEELIEGN